MPGRRGTLLFVLGAFGFGALVFLVASAYLIERDQSKWLAGAVGALAFPVLPLVWQLVGERRRNARLAATKARPKQSLAPADRYLVRAIAVAVVVIGPMVAVGRFAVVRAAWVHKAWFIPETPFDAAGARQDLLARVPSDAETVIVIRDHDDAKPGARTQPGLGVIAYADHQALVIAPEDPDDDTPVADKVKDLNDQRARIPFVTIDPLVVADVAGKLALATTGWRTKVEAGGAGPRTEIVGELDRAPASAQIAVGFVSTRPADRLDIKRASAWLVQNAVNEHVMVGARVEATSDHAAEAFVAVARAAWNAHRGAIPAKCRDEIGKLLDDVEVERAGTVVTFHLVIPPDKLMGLMLCAVAEPD